MFRSILHLGQPVQPLSAHQHHSWAQPHAPAVESVVVTATPLAGANLATIPSKVDADEIMHQAVQALPTRLSNIPGVFQQPASRQEPAVPSFAAWTPTGCASWKTVPAASDASDIGPDHGVPIDPFPPASIEVVRGAGTLRYGSQAIGGRGQRHQQPHPAHPAG
jgi:iron complex outermembrane receptor protein